MRRLNQSEDTTEVEFRIIDVRVKGGNASVIESLRTMAGAFSAKAAMPKAIPAKAAVVDAGPEESPQEELNFGEAAPEPVMAEGSSRTPRPRGPRKAPVAPEILSSLDIKDGKPSFPEFFKLVGEPKDHRRRYLTIAYWVKRHYGTPTPSITAQYAFTVYRLMNWPVPKDALVPLRDAFQKNHWFTRDEKGYAISNIGESVIDKLLAKKP